RRPLHDTLTPRVLGGAPPSAETLAAMARSIGRGDTREAIGLGRGQWRRVGAARARGGNVRVGLEDNFYLGSAGTEMAKGNGPLVEKAVRMARDVGREPMSPDEARKALSLPQAW